MDGWMNVVIVGGWEDGVAGRTESVGPVRAAGVDVALDLYVCRGYGG